VTVGLIAVVMVLIKYLADGLPLATTTAVIKVFVVYRAQQPERMVILFFHIKSITKDFFNETCFINSSTTIGNISSMGMDSDGSKTIG
jgi:hypothetical protein